MSGFIRWDAPGALMLDARVWALVATTALNDHVLKARWPGFVTGKLSDFAGLGFFPVLLISACEVALAAVGVRFVARERAAWLATTVTGVAFCAIKTSAAASDSYERLVSALWLGLGRTRAMSNVVDPGDLCALLALGVAYWVVRRRRRSVAGGENSTKQVQSFQVCDGETTATGLCPSGSGNTGRGLLTRHHETAHPARTARLRLGRGVHLSDAQ